MASKEPVRLDDGDQLVSLVRRIRASRGLTQEGLARELGVSFATVNGWENGRHRAIPALARRLAEMDSEENAPPPAIAQTPVAVIPAASTEVRTAQPDDISRRIASIGWPRDERERRDFYHRPREFPLSMSRWRTKLVERVRNERDQFPLAAAAVKKSLALAREKNGGKSPTDADQITNETLRVLVDEYIAAIREVTHIVAILHGSPDRENNDTSVGRVLSRLDLLRDLGLSLAGLDHKQLQLLLADLVPPNLRHSLDVNLTVHARDICRAQKPLCGDCDLRGFCGNYRRSLVAQVESLNKPRTVDLFAGAGGLSEGFEQTGFSVSLALDADPGAMKTYRFNHPEVPEDRIIARDIRTLVPGELRKLVGRKPIDVLIGAPPCQGYSHVGHRSKSSLTGYSVTSDARNYLYEFMVAAAIELKPRLFLMENVPGMKSARKGNHSFIDSAAHALEKEGFTTTLWRMNAAAHGVPQDRIRYFLVAAAKGERLPERPAEHYQDSAAREFDPEALPAVTFDEAVLGLPPLAADQGNVVDRWPARAETTSARHRRFLGKFRILSSSRLLFNHTVRYHNERDLELYALLRPGEDSVHALERYGRADLMRYRADVFDDKYARLRADRPCKTIVAHLAKDGNGYIHPTQTRSISFREAARIQSFRDDYVFCGAPSDQWVYLGNAVPPVMAAAIAQSFLSALCEEK